MPGARASGEVGGVEKVYAAARVMPDLGQVGTTRTTRAGTGALVLAEFVLQRASSSVYMVFKVQPCERADVLPGFVGGLGLGAVITPV